MTVVFTDLVGSTARAEQLDPEDVRAMLDPYHELLRAELERYGGTVEKFIGDAVMALFGAPVAHEDDPERAVRAALSIRDAITELNASDSWLDLHIRTGINTGEALVKLGARPAEGEGMAAGDVVNTAARLQSAAPVDGILVGEETYRETRKAIEHRERPPIEAKGKSNPVPVWEVIGLKHVGTRRPTSEVRLVGRRAELEQIWKLWEEVRDTRASAGAILLGLPGIGKTRLLEEFVHRVEGATVHWGRCLSYGEGITYWPVIEILKDAAGIRHDDDDAAVSLKLGELLFQIGTDDLDQLRTMATALANLIGAPNTPEGTYSAAEITRAELHWGIRRVLELHATEQPLVLVFEDLHWAEPTLLELVESIARDAAAPIFVLASARPELAETTPGFLAEGRRGLVLSLPGLNEAESTELLDELVGVGHLAVDVVGAPLLRNAGGNPLFLEETVQMLLDEGVLRPGSTEVHAELETLPVPGTLQALIGSRLDRLPAAEKRLAQLASVVGLVFWPGALARIGSEGGAETDLEGGLAALERRDFISSREVSTLAGEREYSFKHALVREVAYARLPKSRRAALHVRFADWTAELPSRQDELVEIIAYHLEQACRLVREVAHSSFEPPIGRAVEALSRAGEKAERREGLREADRYYTRALALVEDEHGTAAAELRLRRGQVLAALGEMGSADEALAQVADDSLALDRLDLRGAALVTLGDIDQWQGRAADARDRLIEAQAIAARTADRRLEIKAIFGFEGLQADFEGSFASAVENLRRAVQIAEEVEDLSLRIEGHLRIGTLLLNVGAFALAERELLRCSALAGEMGSRRDEARATCWLGIVKYYRGEREEAERLSLQAHEWLGRTSDTYFQLQNLRALALYALADHDPELAERWLREALPLALEAGGWLVVEIDRLLVEALVRQGRLTEADALAEQADKDLPDEDPYAHAALLLARATLAAGTGRQHDMERCYRQALELLEDQHLVIDVGEARLGFARALEVLGDAEAARSALKAARETFAQTDASGAIAEIDRRLAALGDEPGLDRAPSVNLNA